MPPSLITPTTPELSEIPSFQPIQASMVALDGFIVRDDFSTTIQRYIRRETVLWQLIKKRQATGDPVKTPREGPLPTVGFVSKIDLNPPENPSDLLAADLTEAGQSIKAISGIIKVGHYARSLYRAQGRPLGDIVAEKTEKLLLNIVKLIERNLFTGSATSNPLSFNGIANQMQSGRVYPVDTTAGTNNSVITKLRSVVRLAVNDPNISRSITHIFASGLGLEQIEKELLAQTQYNHVLEIIPGVKVPAIMTQVGPIPIVPTPYIQDTDGGAGTDTLHYYLVNIDEMSWQGVYPEGGEDTFNPQIFDVSAYTSDAAPYLLEKRMGLIYGTLYAENAGESTYRVDAIVPTGTVGTA